MDGAKTPSGGPNRLKPGQPTKLTQEIIDRIVSYVRVGSYIETAAVASGVAKQTFYNWLKAANDLREKLHVGEVSKEKVKLAKSERLLLAFLDAVEKAAAEAEMADIVTIRKASESNWQASAWRLERRSPDRWGRRDFVKQEMSGPNNTPIPVETTDTTGMSTAEKDDLIKRHYERIRRNRPADARA